MRFIADGMLGGLGRLLRMLGVDCSSYSGSQEGLIIQAKKEGRIILTRNTRLRKREGVVFITPLRLIDQLQKINQIYDIKGTSHPLTRCLICNEKIRPVSREEVRDKIPYYTYLHFEEFYQCPICNRIYWNGSHRQEMEERIKRIVDALG